MEDVFRFVIFAPVHRKKTEPKSLQSLVLGGVLHKHGERAGGNVVAEFPSAEGLEVDSIIPLGRAQAVVSLSPEDVRKLSLNDMFAVRPVQKVP